MNKSQSRDNPVMIDEGRFVPISEAYAIMFQPERSGAEAARKRMIERKCPANKDGSEDARARMIQRQRENPTRKR